MRDVAVLCRRVADAPAGPNRPACQRTCSRCSAPVWVLEASLRDVAMEGRPVFYCTRCLSIEDLAAIAARVLPWSRETRAELASDLDPRKAPTDA